MKWVQKKVTLGLCWRVITMAAMISVGMFLTLIYAEGILSSHSQGTEGLRGSHPSSGQGGAPPGVQMGSQGLLARRDIVFGMFFQNSKTGWIVGVKGLVLRTDDGGGTWERQEPLTDAALYDVTFVNNTGFMVGERGIILRSRDGGKQWEMKEKVAGTDASLMGVSFFDTDAALAIGEGGTILRTKDGGETWEDRSANMLDILPEELMNRGVTTVNFYDLSLVGGTHGWIVGDSGIVFYTADAGESWEVLEIGLYPALFSVFFKDSAEGFAAGQRGLFLHSMDGGRTWQELDSQTEESLYRITMDGDDGIVVGEDGMVLQTSDGGKLWKSVEVAFMPPPPWLIDAAIVGPKSSKKSVVCIGESRIKEILLPKQR